jgi:hypothetical protein
MKKLRLKDFISIMKEELSISSKSEPVGLFSALIGYLSSDFESGSPILNFFGGLMDTKWKDMERMYYLHSNRKYISTNVIDTMEMYEGNATDIINQLASYIRYEFEAKWAHIIDVMEREYNPINNYDMQEHEETNMDITDKLSHNADVTKKTSHNADATNKISHNINKDTSVTIKADSSIENQVSGFNGGLTPSSKTITTADPTKNENKTNETALALNNYDEEHKTALALDNYDEEHETANALNNYDENKKSALAKDNYRDLSRSGNIGVTTSQQMISSELELRRNIILNDIFNDIDKVLCLKIY